MYSDNCRWKKNVWIIFRIYTIRQKQLTCVNKTEGYDMQQKWVDQTICFMLCDLPKQLWQIEATEEKGGIADLAKRYDS